MEWGLLREVAIYSFWIFLNVIMDKIYWSTGQFVLGSISGTIAVSVFAIAIQLEGMYMTFSTAISSVFLPKVTGMVTRSDNKKQISDLFIRTGRIQNVIMTFILFGFIVFGRPFIYLWAGVEYLDAYYMALAFFVSLYIPLIQNLGVTILQARNQMQFRSILYIIIACIALLLEIVASKIWGGIGCALAISLALLLGQGLFMNIYYNKKQNIDIIQFWIQIIKMDIAPFIISLISYFIIYYCFPIGSWIHLFLSISIYSFIYLFSAMLFSINEEERILLLSPIMKLLQNDKHTR